MRALAVFSIKAFKVNFSNWVLFLYKSDLNETLISHLTDFESISCLIIYRSYIAHKNELKGKER